MHLGEYKFWVTLFEKTYTLDEQGGRIETLRPVGQCWAFIEEKNEAAGQEEMREEYRNRLECHIKTTKEVKPGMAVQVQGKYYEIKQAVRNFATIYDVRLLCEEMLG